MAKPRPTSRRGAISLCLAVTGMCAVEAAVRFEVGSPVAMRILGGAFEAATVGAIADWFAVTALFRRIPLPWIGRHTNLLVRNRAQFTLGIVDVVQNRWLAPAVVRERLTALSASKLAIETLGDAAARARVVHVLRGTLKRANEDLDGTIVVEFVERLVVDSLRNVDLGRPLGRWIRASLERGSHAALWDVILASAEQSVRGGALERIVKSGIAQAVEAYAATDTRKRWFVKGATFFGFFDPAVAADKAIEALARTLREARGAPEHPLRVRIDAALLDLAAELEAGRGDASEAVGEFQTRLAEHPGLREVVRTALSRVRVMLAAELEQETGDAAAVLDRVLAGVARDLEAHDDTRASLDAWVREMLGELVEKHHGEIGAMVRSSVDRLSDEELVQQVEDKVGDDLQWIRVNGAVIGALVGALLASAKIVSNG